MQDCLLYKYISQGEDLCYFRILSAVDPRRLFWIYLYTYTQGINIFRIVFYIAFLWIGPLLFSQATVLYIQDCLLYYFLWKGLLLFSHPISSGSLGDQSGYICTYMYTRRKYSIFGIVFYIIYFLWKGLLLFSHPINSGSLGDYSGYICILYLYTRHH